MLTWASPEAPQGLLLACLQYSEVYSEALLGRTLCLNTLDCCGLRMDRASG